MADVEPGGPYRLIVLDGPKQKLRAFAARAAARRMPRQFAADLDDVERRVRTEPFKWGDPQYDYHHLGMTRQRGRSAFLYVYFSVHEPTGVVYVQDVEFHPYSSLYDDPPAGAT